MIFLSWSLTLLHLIIENFINDFLIGVVTAPTALFLNAFASFRLPESLQKLSPLIPALKSNWLIMHVTVMLFSYATLICGCLLSITFLFLFDNPFENLLKYTDHRLAVLPFSVPKDGFAFKRNQDAVSKKNFRSMSGYFIDEVYRQDVGQKTPQAPRASAEVLPIGRALPFDTFNWNRLKTNNIRFQESPLEFSQEDRPKAPIKPPLNGARGGTFRFFASGCPKASWAKGSLREALSAWGLGFGQNAEKPNGGKAGNPVIRFGQHPKRYREQTLQFFPQQAEGRSLRQQESQLGVVHSQFPPSTQLVSQEFHFFENERKNLLQKLDQLSFRAIGIGFPFLTIGILSGSVWANEAWGSYWNWDPKETWSLITWIIFAIYLHLRLTKNWDGLKSAILATIGFLSIWVCFLGVNFLAKGLHSYGWFH